MNQLSKKQKGFIKDYVKTGNATISALNNYDTDDERVAQTIGSENLSKPMIQEAIKSIADRIPDELVEKVHLEGLQATQGENPDYSVRHKYLDSAYKLKGSYAPDKNINVNMTIKTIDPTDTKVLEALRIIDETI
jgi:hypothetical protein